MKTLTLLLATIMLVACGVQTPSTDDMPPAPEPGKETVMEKNDDDMVLPPEELPTDDLLVAPEPLSLSNENDTVVVVENLTERQMIESPLAIIGTARRDWFFEGSFPVTLMNLDETVVKEWYATGAWLEPIDDRDIEDLSGDDMIAFEANIEFEAPGLEVDGGKIRFGKSVVGDEDTEEYVEMMVLWP